jgi:hypothetical protein
MHQVSSMNFEQLRVLTAIADEGTFEAAADLVGVSPSAVSQRITALEASVGQVVMRRGVPCTPPRPGRCCSERPARCWSSKWRPRTSWAAARPLGRDPGGRQR